jgi:hypothetical protein
MPTGLDKNQQMLKNQSIFYKIDNCQGRVFIRWTKQLILSNFVY